MSISCVKCNYAITEPLCAHCIINGVKLWFYERRIKQKIVRQINYQLTNLLRQIDSLDYAINPFEDVLEESTIKCICCNKEMHLMCFYCVNIQASQIVKNNLRSKETKESFEESFNMEFYNYSLTKAT